eukprot:UN10300
MVSTLQKNWSSFVSMAVQYPEIAFFKVDVDENAEVAEKQGIRAMPTFKFYQNGENFAEFSGANETNLRGKLDELRAK